MPPTPPLARLRRRYHERLCAELLSSRDGGELNIADGSQAASVELAREMLVSMKMKPWGGNPSAQQLGSKFATITCDFLEKAFRLLHHVRPGAWTFSTAPGETGISHFAQYAHLAMLKRLLDERPDLKASWGGDYIIRRTSLLRGGQFQTTSSIVRDLVSTPIRLSHPARPRGRRIDRSYR